MKPEHKPTPGPYKAAPILSASENHRGWRIIGRDGPYKIVVVAEVYPLGPDPTPEAEANLALFLAAPALLAALELIAMQDVGKTHEWQAGVLFMQETARAAIAKARGE